MNYRDLQLLIRQEIASLLGPRMGPHNYPSAKRRVKRRMCEHCMDGKHARCDSYGCPCVCNDRAWYAQTPVSA